MSAGPPQLPRGQFDPYAPRSAPNGFNWKLWLTVGGAVCLALCGCLGFLVVGAIGIPRADPTPEERQALVTIDDLVPFGAQPVNQDQREVYSAKRNLDGSVEISYDYDADRAPKGDEVFTLSSAVEINLSERSARESFGTTIGAFKLGLGIYDVEAEKDPYEMPGVDQSYFASIRTKSVPVGNMVVVRKGKMLHSVLLVGLHFDRAEDLAAILEGKIARAEALRD